MSSCHRELPESALFQASYGEIFAHSLQASPAPLSSPQWGAPLFALDPGQKPLALNLAGSAHSPSQAQESLADPYSPVPGMDPSSHGQRICLWVGVVRERQPRAGLEVPRAMGTRAGAHTTHTCILSSPDGEGGMEVARGTEHQVLAGCWYTRGPSCTRWGHYFPALWKRSGDSERRRALAKVTRLGSSPGRISTMALSPQCSSGRLLPAWGPGLPDQGGRGQQPLSHQQVGLWALS